MGNKRLYKKVRSSGPRRCKLRHFRGNKFITSSGSTPTVTEEENSVLIPATPDAMDDTVVVEEDVVQSASAKKLKYVYVVDTPSTSTTLTDEEEDDIAFHYVIIDSQVLQTILDVVGKCPKCNNNVVFNNMAAQKKGLANLLRISCNDCDFVYTTYSSKQVVREGLPGQNPYDINARAIVGFREIGKGYSGLETVFGIMNFLPVMSKDSFNEMNKDIAACYSKVAQDSMSEAGNDLHKGDENLVCDVAVSCDGTWQKRGFSSLLGAVTVISVETGKCLDYKAMSKKCALCTSWEGRKGTAAYEEFINVIRDSHECSINHDGSAGSMEAKGVVECFTTSVEKHNLQYTEYLGDGDSKSYKEVCDADPYGKPIAKLECIGHIQKRVGRKLRNMKGDGLFKDLYDSDDDSGTGKKKKKKLYLTDKIINKLQNYYGIAVRACTGRTVEEMKCDIGAALYHCSEVDTDDQRHMFCPKTEMSWCKYQADKVNNTNTYKNTRGIHNKIFKLVKPVFMELSNNELLKKCLHGKTQNTNESLNGVIWKKCPKDVYVGRPTLEMGINSAIISFNCGASSILDVTREYGLEDGIYAINFCYKKDELRVKESNRKVCVKGKSARKRLRAIRKGFGDKEKEKEGEVYGAGICDT